MNNVANKRIVYCSRAERSLLTAALLAVPEPELFFSWLKDCTVRNREERAGAEHQ
jgi:hypothetical protein